MFLSSWISLAISFKKTKVELELLTDIEMLLMVEKVSETKYVMLAIHRYVKADNKNVKNYDKNKESP